MSEKKYTPGPWKAVTDPCHFDTLSDVVGGKKDKTKTPDVQLFVSVSGHCGAEEQEANAHLIAAAPAMDVALRMIAAKVARIECSGMLQEFCFNGLRYIMNGDWNALLNAIGWDVATTAIAKAESAQ